ncbi:PAS domain S-box-containing protein [Paucidesulfovibrio gracilis DSM 16080]|uniref:PAS domain S-box-containing protein n=1 Tax=Paucidesulfovibrio gracilis DSM 16080 TaxID=1121449 RepID=A0A1T4X760_9BACT|nr:PAS domain-containing protein [Paucidesulfovibrio gracilis]SKA85257.1 PAS domain S-box-containing protein [Paucidesulfovibrio gracilis DSM 16080]
MTDESTGRNMDSTPIHAPSDVVDALRDHMLFTDAQGRVIHANSKAQRFYGNRVHRGRPFWEVLGLTPNNHADQSPGLQSVLKRWPPDRVHEIRAPKGDTSWSLRIVRLPEACGAKGFVVMATDNRPIVELHERVQERVGESVALLDYSVRLFNTLFDTALDAMFLLDEERLIRTVNPRASRLFDPEQQGLTGRDMVELLAPEQRNPFSAALATLDDGETWNTRLTALGGQGLDLPVRAVLRRIDLDQHCLYHLSLRDLTNRTRLERGLERKSREVEGMNLALQNVVRSADEARNEARKELVDDLRRDLLPAIRRMAREPDAQRRVGYLEMVRERLDGLYCGDGEELSPLLLRLTPRELEVCRLIRTGRGGKEIAELLNASFETIQTHRKNIRRKLGLKGRRVALASFLQGLPGLE